ncbi:MAG: transglycosylase SLT domain-containing protein [Desulfobacterales bacterium]|jgi:hypothetical protein
MNKITIVTLTLLFVVSPHARGGSSENLEPSVMPSLVSSLRIDSNLDFCGEATPLDVQEVRERWEKELLLTLADRPQVILWIKRSHRYLPIITRMLSENHMPDDLKYIPIVESALRPHVGSPKGAIGFWQFMESTGRIYDLKIDAAIDERRNIFKSTRAAILYFKALYEDLGTWTLAAAAYNMGEEGLKAEMLTQKTNNFYQLYLPLETQRYIFRIIAAKTILSNPGKYGFRINEDELYPPLEFDRLEIQLARKVPIHIVAQAAGTYFKVIKDLNPEIRGHFLAEGNHAILVPKGAAADFHARYETALNDWVSNRSEQIYIVKEGDNLSSIASSLKVPLPALLIWNNLNPNKHIHPGDQLIIYPPDSIDEKIELESNDTPHD